MNESSSPVGSHRETFHSALRFVVVAAVGYALNLLVFTLAVEWLHVAYAVAATIALIAVLINNFLLHSRWTFQQHMMNHRQQIPKFIVVSAVAFTVNLVMLHVFIPLVAWPTLAQALALAVATPINFLGNRFWTFRK